MATWTNINTPSLVTAGTPSSNTVSAATDQFAVQFGRKYLIRFSNASANAGDVRIVDPTIPAREGVTLPSYATAAAAVPVTTGVRTFLVDAARFRDSNGNVVLQYSLDMTNANSKAEVYLLP